MSSLTSLSELADTKFDEVREELGELATAPVSGLCWVTTSPRALGFRSLFELG